MLSLLSLLFVVTIHKVNCDDIISQLNINHLKQHEKVYFNQTETITSSNIMEFDAFDQHYVIELDLVEHLIPNNVIQHHPPGDDEIEPYYTSLTESCHYHGRVVNTNDEDDYAILSFCPKRGIRGEVRAFGDKIYIKPTAAYEQQFRHSDINEEHLIYRASDEIIDRVIDQEHKKRIGATTNEPLIEMKSRRRLYNSGKQTIQVLVINGAARTKYYTDKYGSSYKQELNSDYGDMFSKIDGPYDRANWASSIGSVTVVFSQLDILTDYDDIGRPSGSRESSYNNNPCSSQSEMLKAKCSVSCDSYLSKTQNYIRKHSGFDTVALVDLVPFEFNGQSGGGWSATLGYACVGCMCRSSAASVNWDSTLHEVNAGSDTTAETIAHEIGHNFNMKHDGDNGCSESAGLMGQGGLSKGFSSCSRKDALNGFKYSGFSCLGGGGGSYNGDDGGNDDGDYDYDGDNDYNGYNDDNGDNGDNGRDDPPSSGGSCSGGSCVEISGMKSDSEGRSYNGQWNKKGCEGSYAYYQHSSVDNLYLCYDGGWVITERLCSGSDDYVWAYCRSSSSSWNKCIDNWKIWRSGRYSSDSSVDLTSSCGAFDFQDDDEAECLKDMEHTQISIDGGGDIWSGKREFNLVEGRCSNQHPVYYYATYDDDGSVDQIYYLHFVEERVDDEMIGEWVISAEDMYVVGDAYCSQDDVSQCGTNTWNVKHSDGDSVRYILSEDMTVAFNTDVVNQSEQSIWIIWCVVCGILIVAIIYIILKKKKRDPKVVIDDESEEEVEVDVEIDGDEANVLTNRTDVMSIN